MAGFRSVRTLTLTYQDVQWHLDDEQYLAKVVAVVLLGQALHAARLIETLDPIAPVFTDDNLIAEAIASVVVSPGTDDEMKARRWHRDGLLFEVLSWVSLVETHVGAHYLIRDPHLGSTAQGLDGLMLELDLETGDIRRTILLEDKCSGTPRRTFEKKVLPAFQLHHTNKRSPSLVAAAANLLRAGGGEPASSTQRAAAVVDLSKRGYRASLALETSYAESAARTKLFDGYDGLTGMDFSNREGGGFEVGASLRPWFDQFAAQVRSELERMKGPKGV